MVYNESGVKCRKCLICSELYLDATYRPGQKGVGFPVATPSIAGLSLGKAEHCKLKHDGKQYACHMCGKQMILKDNYAYHLKTQHGVESEGYNFIECHFQDCNHILKTKWDFGVHLSVHCAREKRGPNRKQFLKHTYSSGGDVFQKWKQDKRKSTEESKAIENNEKDIIGYQCEQCGHHCTNAYPELELELHKAIWHGTEHLICHRCGKSFTDKYSMSQHVNMA